uniref:TATA box-binding protein-associated factor RNA polymerase I subunit B n=1 Tax=Anopheles dirus TaxID=7168 RepID=A0A182NGG2_9DIPT
MDVCEVCGLSDFSLQDGGYYCNECGTKLLHKRELVGDGLDNIGLQIRTKQKIEYAGTLTSWEQLNYMLNGLSQRMVELGAPAEFKKTVLQLWCSFLRYSEVAFFSKRIRHRPLVPLKSRRSDLEHIFNRKAVGRPKKKTKSYDAPSKKQKRALSRSLMEAEAEELAHSQQSDLDSTMSTLSNSMQSSSTSCQPPLNFKFNSRARKHLMKELLVTEEHIEWHEEEAPLDATCHQIIYQSVGRNLMHDSNDWSLASRNTILIAILALALNQHRCPILMTDLLRWIEEGHLPFYNLKQYVPEGMDPACYTQTSEQLATGYQGFSNCKVITSMMGTDLGIVPVEPDLVALSQRFLSELALPLDFVPFIRKLIVIAPPISRSNLHCYFPSYELHAMKYILFVMKLLFGLDGVIEAKLDAATKKLNERFKPSCNQPKLFVWEEWQQYVAMRSVILEQLHYPTSHYRNQSVVNQPIDSELFLDFFASRITPDDDTTTGYQSTMPRSSYKPARERLFKNIHSVIALAIDSHQNQSIESTQKGIDFGHSLQPQQDYMTKILQMDDEARHYVHIPKYMYADHSSRTVAPFINPMALKKHFLEHDRVRLTMKDIQPSRKHIHMSKYKSHISNIELFLVRRKFCNVVEKDDSGSSDSGSNNESSIMDYIDARAEANRISPEDLFQNTLCQNALDELEADLQASINASDPIGVVLKDKRSLNEPLPDEHLCSDTVQIVLPNFYYWVNNGNLANITYEVFEHEYFSTFPPSFQFLLREAAYVTRCSPLALYNELNEIEKYFFKVYKRIK